MRHAITIAACSLLFVIGFSLQPILSGPRKALVQAGESAKSGETEKVPLQASFDPMASFLSIKEANERGLPFQTHYLALYTAHLLDAKDLATMLQLSEELRGAEAGIVSLIFGLELAYRDRDALINFIKNQTSTGNQNFDLQSLFRYWAKSDPESAFETAMQLPEPSRSQAMQGIVYSGNESFAEKVRAYRSNESSSDAKKLEFAKAVESELWRKNRFEFLNLFQSAFSDSPEEGVAFAKEIENPILRNRALDSLFNSQWDDPVDALQTIHELQTERLLENPRTRLNYISRVLRNSDNGQIEPALDWLSKTYSPQEHAAIIESLSLTTSASSRAILRSTFFQQIPDSSVKTAFLSRTISSIANDNWQDALRLVEQSVPPDRVEYVLPSLVTQAYTNAGPEVAKELISVIEQPHLQSQAVSQLAHSWGVTDPAAFLTWAASQPNELPNPYAFDTVSSSWAQTNFAELREFESSLESGIVKESLQRKIGQTLAESNPLAAIEYSLQMENHADSTNLLIEAARMWAMDDPKSAVSFVNTALTPEESERAAQVIASEWAQRDAAAATAYFNSISDRKSGQAGLTSSLSHWLRVDVNSATNYLSSIPAGQPRDSVCVNFVADSRNSLLYPKETLRVINLIDDSTQREEAKRSYDKVRNRYESP